MKLLNLIILLSVALTGCVSVTDDKLEVKQQFLNGGYAKEYYRGGKRVLVVRKFKNAKSVLTLYNGDRIIALFNDENGDGIYDNGSYGDRNEPNTMEWLEKDKDNDLSPLTESEVINRRNELKKQIKEFDR